MRIKTVFIALLAFVGLSVGTAHSADVTISTNDNAVILNGYDAVSYFTESKPVKGSVSYTSVYKNAIYRFSSAENRDTFNANPSKYAPQYGGYCAYGASLGKKFAIDGKGFKVVDGKLYVQKNVDVAKIWEKDISGNIKLANGHWDTIKDTPASEL